MLLSVTLATVEDVTPLRDHVHDSNPLHLVTTRRFNDVSLSLASREK